MALHSSGDFPLAWKIPWMEEPGRLQSRGSWRVRHDWATSLSFSTVMQWRGNGNPLQCSCLENPRDRGSWWAAVYGVAQSHTQSQTLKWLSSSSSRSSLAVLEGKKFLESIIYFLGKKVLWLTHFYLWNAQWRALVFTAVTTVRWKNFDLCTGHKQGHLSKRLQCNTISKGSTS